MAGRTGSRSRLRSGGRFWELNQDLCESTDNNFAGVSVWCDSSKISSFIGKVRVGDKLQFRARDIQSCLHFGIYVGEWEASPCCVVHFIPRNEEGRAYSKLKTSFGLYSLPASKDVLVVNTIHKIVSLQEGEVRINNLRDTNSPPLSTVNVLQEVIIQLEDLHTECRREQVRHYVCRMSFKDSEDFVNYCRHDDCRINFGLVSDWCDSRRSLPRVRPGDRLEFRRKARPYKHWGIYVDEWEEDDGSVNHDQLVHFAPTPGNGKTFFKRKSSRSESSAKDKPVFHAKSIEEVLGNDKVRINNSRDRTLPPSAREDILDEIKYKWTRQSVDSSAEYRLFSNNCEHFVNCCRYGTHLSDQVDRLKSAIKKS